MTKFWNWWAYVCCAMCNMCNRNNESPEMASIWVCRGAPPLKCNLAFFFFCNCSSTSRWWSLNEHWAPIYIPHCYFEDCIKFMHYNRHDGCDYAEIAIIAIFNSSLCIWWSRIKREITMDTYDELAFISFAYR